MRILRVVAGLVAVLSMALARGAVGQESQPVPVADAKAMVMAGHARFTVLTPKLVRMEWAADGVFEDRASFVFLNRKMPVPAFKQRVSKSEVEIKTEALTLVYKPSMADGGKFTAASLRVSFVLDGKAVEWMPGMVDAGNLLGTTRTLDGARGNQTKSPIEPGLISRAGWVVVDDSERPLFDSTDFSFKQGEASAWPWVTLRPAGAKQDLYFFGYGHAYKEELGDFVKVAGRIPLPPRFAFGSWWSRYWAYSDQELEELVAGFRENSVPLDVLVIDMDWHPNFGVHKVDGRKAPVDQSGERKGWGGYTWNGNLFPDPKKFLTDIHDQGLKVTLNLHPASGIEPWEKPYPEMARAMGIDPATQKYVPFDITDKKFAMNYMELLHHPLEKQGVDFWWLDWQQGQTTKLAGVNPTWWLNYVHFTDQEREGKRPLLFHRWGGLGNHRYQIGFSGDTVSVWDSLAFQPYFTSTAANVGYAYWSHDIGGHMPGAVDPEIFTRWIQFGAFSPILRTHTTKNAESERRIWAYPEPYADVMRKAFQQRTALEPYTYTEARRTYDSGVAFVRPLYYDWPEAKEAYDVKNAYMFGDEMMVAPVVAPVDAATQMATVKVWVPAGEWVEKTSGKHLVGPMTTERHYAIDEMPLFLKAGAIVPMQPPMEFTGQKPVDPLIVSVTPLAEGQQTHYAMYDDTSQGEAYKDGVNTWTDLSAKRAGDDVTVAVAAVRGSYAGMIERRGYEVRLAGDWPPETVTANGVAVAYEPRMGMPGWRFEGNTLTTVVTLAQSSVHEAVRVVVHHRTGLSAKRAELDGFAGATSRLRQAYDDMNHAGGRTWSPDSLTFVWETGDRMTYKPETAETEMDAFRARVDVARKELATQIVAEVPGKDASAKDAEMYKVMTVRAVAALGDF